MQELVENNAFCMKCLFLFYPRLVNDFLTDLTEWCKGRVMGEMEQELAQMM